MELTKIELEVMNVLWNADRPLTKSEIMELSENRSWKDSYKHLLINGLIKKGAIKESGVTKSGKVWAAVYDANISCEDYFSKNVFAGSSRKVLPMLFNALIKTDGLSPELIDELEEMLKKKRQGMD